MESMTLRATLGSLALLAIAWAPTGCAPSPTELVVVVDTDLEIPSELDELEIVVEAASGTHVQREPLTRDAVPATLGVSPSGDDLGPVVVRASGLLEGAVVVSREARVTLVRGESRTLVLHLTRACVGVGCEDGETCDGNGSCHDVDVGELPPWTGEPPRLRPDGGTADGGTSDGGAIDGSIVDGGMIDGGAIDSSVDGGPPPDCTVDSDCPAPVLGAWSACESGDTCATTGMRSRAVTAYQCVAGSCAPAESTESESCSRTTDGDPCGGTTCGGWSACTSTDPCSTAGTESRSCTDPVCAGGTCSMPARTETRACTLPSTDGAPCGADSCGTYGICSGSTVCDQTGSQSRTCHQLRCGAGVCSMVNPYTDTSACTRDTDGRACGSGRTCDTGVCVCTFC